MEPFWDFDLVQADWLEKFVLNIPFLQLDQMNLEFSFRGDEGDILAANVINQAVKQEQLKKGIKNCFAQSLQMKWK